MKKINFYNILKSHSPFFSRRLDRFKDQLDTEITEVSAQAALNSMDDVKTLIFENIRYNVKLSKSIDIDKILELIDEVENETIKKV